MGKEFNLGRFEVFFNEVIFKLRCEGGGGIRVKVFRGRVFG